MNTVLSRVAESLFWIGRYLERADGTARILDVHLQLVLEDPSIDEDQACRSLLSIMGLEQVGDSAVTSGDVLELLAEDQSHPASIAYSLYSARENARRAREIISTELWECLNAIATKMPRRLAADRVHSFCTWVRERSAMASGITYTTMSRDEAYQFFVLGQFLERADMTARLLATSELTQEGGPSWTAILRSCGAYESCLRTYRGVPSTPDAAEFLLLDRLFPRSIAFSIQRALGALGELDPGTSRRGGASTAQRLLEQATSSLQYRPIEEVVAELPYHMDQIQVATSAASEAVKARFFPSEATPTWVGEKA
ncbi:MAG: alpha-E domain-containing protein [Bifidobacteriaceae bacterium]|nr:alpha-E domain-containing protein [Bifidobacteriaceae bacterium]